LATEWVTVLRVLRRTLRATGRCMLYGMYDLLIATLTGDLPSVG
jgi:hypothetical protein